MQTLLQHLTRAILKSPRTTLGLILLSVVVSLVYTATYLTFKTERSDLIDPEAVFHRRWLKYTESFGDGADLVVTVEADQPEQIKELLDLLGQRLADQPEYFSHVLYKIDPSNLRKKGLQYLSPQQLQSGLEMLTSLKPVLAGQWDQAGIKPIADQLTFYLQGLKYLPDGQSRESRVLAQADQLAQSLLSALTTSNDFLPPWPQVVEVPQQTRQEADHIVYLLSRNGKMGFLKAFPVKQESEFGGALGAISQIRHELALLKKQFPQARFGLTGIPVLESDEMTRSQDDMLLSSVISFVGVGIVLILGFHGLTHTLLCLAMLAVGMCWSFAFATAAIGHLNILSVSFAAILIGLGIDFAIHYLSHYLDLRHKNLPVKKSLMKTTSTIGAGVITASITTSLAFLCACFTEFLGIAELGIIAGGGIILCMLCSFVVNPILIYYADRKSKPKQLPTPFQAHWLRNLTAKMPVTIALFSFISVAIVCSQVIDFNSQGDMAFKLKYDPNLLNLQAEGLDSVDVQKRIDQETDESLLFAVSIADSASQARARAQQFIDLPAVQHVEELGKYLPEYDPQSTQLLVQAYHSYVTPLPELPPEAIPVDPSEVGASVENLYHMISTLENPLGQPIVEKLNLVLDHLDAMPLPTQLAFLKDYQYQMRRSLYKQLEDLSAVSDPEPVTLNDLPASLVRRFISPQGEWLIQIFPKNEIWDDQPLAEFVTELRTVDPEVTGTPLQNYEASAQIQSSYMHSAIYALLCITAVLLIDFNRNHRVWMIFSFSFLATSLAYAYADSQEIHIHQVFWVMTMECLLVSIALLMDRRGLSLTLLAMMPPVIGMLTLFGCMAIFTINFNPANMIVLPLILGIGVDVGVHILHDYLHYEDSRLLLPTESSSHDPYYKTSGSTMNAIFLTSITTMMGFGSMMIAAHRGLASLGMVLTLGVGCCLIIGMIPLPALLNLLSRRMKFTSDENSTQASEDSDHSINSNPSRDNISRLNTRPLPESWPAANTYSSHHPKS